MIKYLCLLALVASAAIEKTRALTCLDGQSPWLTEATETTWEFCSVIEATGGHPAQHHGLGPENDDTERYSRLFEGEVMGPFEYAVTAACVLEKTADALHGTTEFKVRCFCKSNNCNKADSAAELFQELQ